EAIELQEVLPHRVRDQCCSKDLGQAAEAYGWRDAPAASARALPAHTCDETPRAGDDTDRDVTGRRRRTRVENAVCKRLGALPLKHWSFPTRPMTCGVARRGALPRYSRRVAQHAILQSWLHTHRLSCRPKSQCNQKRLKFRHAIYLTNTASLRQ